AAWNKTFEGSAVARAVFYTGAERARVEFWLLALLWCIPYERWNNAYSLLAAVLLLLLFYAHAMKTGKPLDLTGTGFYPTLFFGAVTLAMVFSFSPPLSARFLVYHISAALLCLLTVSAVETAEDLKRLCAAGAACVLVTGAYGILQRLQGLEVNKSYVDLKVNPDMPGRVFSVFDNPNTFAQVLILLLPLVFALALCSKRVLSKLVALGTFFVGALALVMTYSRASWVGLAVAAAVFLFLWRPRLIPLFVLLAVAAVPLLPVSVVQRLASITNMKDTSTASRVPLYQAALAVIRRSPLAGAGLGTDVTRRYIKLFNLYHGHSPFVHSHNFYLEVWIQTGLLGVVSFLASMLWNTKNAARAARRGGKKSDARVIAAAASASLCGAMVCGMADYLWNYPRVMCIFWFTFAVAVGAAKCRAAEAAE
ncbi:MAG: O-antigen ligase family protein, partial [Oscillibacter sp.]|nr:O-antigen ligase family protein [Oscillibacter sp.]